MHILTKTLLTLFSYLLFTEVTLSCDNNLYDKEELSFLVNRFREYAERGQAKRELRTLDNLLKDCAFSDYQSLGISSTEVKQLLIKSKKVKFNKLKDRIMKSKTSEGLSLLRRYRNSAQELDIPPSEIESFIKKQSKVIKKKVKDSNNKRDNLINTNCETKNLSNTLPPQRDQDGIGWCYAFVAADLISQKTGQNISPFDLALAYNSEDYRHQLKYGGDNNKYTSPKNVSSAEGGFIHSAIRAVREKGACREKDLPSESSNYSLKSLILKLSSLSREERTDPYTACGIHKTYNPSFPNLSSNEFVDILAKNAHQDLVSELATMNCNKKDRMPMKDHFEKITSIKYPNVNFHLPSKLQESLKENRIIGISVALDSILKRELVDSKKPSYHAMSIVGQIRNPKTNKCDFLVRNSWGNSCSAFNQEVQCKEGMLTIPIDVMKRIVSGTTELK